jgi:predicted dinucleotide-binding enzyme
MGRAIAVRALAGGHEVDFIGTHVSKAQPLVDELAGEGPVRAVEYLDAEVAVLAVPTPRRRMSCASMHVSCAGP